LILTFGSITILSNEIISPIASIELWFLLSLGVIGVYAMEILSFYRKKNYKAIVLIFLWQIIGLPFAVMLSFEEYIISLWAIISLFVFVHHGFERLRLRREQKRQGKK